METSTGEILSESKLGEELTSIAALPRVSHEEAVTVAVTDYSRHQLIFATIENGNVGQLDRVSVPRYPVAVTVSPDGSRCAVASRWSRRLAFITLQDRHATPTVVDLPFAPHCLAFSRDGSLLVGEAFGGQLGLLPAGQVSLRIHQTPFHNIRDFAVRDGRLWFSHQLLRDTARTEKEHIHWGVLLENFVSSVPIDLLRKDSSAAEGEETLSLDRVRIGDAGDGAGDPTGVAVLSDRLAVTLAGTAELALIDRVGVRELRIPVGTRPIQVLCDEDRQQAFVLNSLGESVTVVNLAEPDVLRTVPLGETPVPGRIERGEAAFFNARLSLENWMSCHSCHTDGHTSNRLADTLGDGGYGNAKRIPTLLGTNGTGPWAWTGAQKSLRGQVQKSFRSTMHAQNPGPGLVSDLTAYLRTLPPAPSLSGARSSAPEELRTPRADLAVGARLFDSSGCVECHVGRYMTADSAFDVGLEDQLGLRRFNPPSLRGVSQRDRLLHDGRVKSLEELLTVHPPGLSLSPADRTQLIRFLNSL